MLLDTVFRSSNNKKYLVIHSTWSCNSYASFSNTRWWNTENDFVIGRVRIPNC